MMDFLPYAPQVGAIVRLRQRRYLVEEVHAPSIPGTPSRVDLACVEDDAQGEPLSVLWELEIDASIQHSTWNHTGPQALDPPRRFAAYLNTLRYACVTSTDPELFQAPWRAGIDLVNYQLEPLRKALLLPRVNLLIADDVGLGKTIEAGLILRELIIRQRVRRTIIAVPPSVVFQWKDELEQRFGLSFIVYDRAFVSRCRRERGYGINPWRSHSRFIISHALLRNEEYRAPLRDVLSDFDPGSLFILDEAHHVAPASSSHYAIDSQLTHAVRDIADRFEHRLFLSATPHNGLSNSFSALLNLLDPQRFVRGTAIDPKLRDHIMVRRLKSDIRQISGGFPIRKVLPIVLKDLPEDTPELVLARLLDQYWELRMPQLDTLSKKSRATQGLVFVNLQKRLCSSIEAFVRTLSAHHKGLVASRTVGTTDPMVDAQQILRFAPGSDDDHADDAESVTEELEEMAMAQTTGTVPIQTGLNVVERMREIAQTYRTAPDARVRYLLQWIKDHLCPHLPYPAPSPRVANDGWAPARVVIFTEYADTKRYLEYQLRAYTDQTDWGPARVATFHGGMSDESREAVKSAFNQDPGKHPLRILIATDAAREGVNLQNHCADLFHFDLPWNPSRMEQRNGRIDRKLQPSSEVRCHYFLYPQRVWDRVFEVLVERTAVIVKELGAVPPVVEQRWEKRLESGILPRQTYSLAADLETDTQTAQQSVAQAVVREELESGRVRAQALDKQIADLRRLLDHSKKTVGYNEDHLRHMVNESLALLGASPLVPIDHTSPATYRLPDTWGPEWADTLETLRVPEDTPGRPQRFSAATPERPLKPVVFRDPGHISSETVHLHLEHPLVKRLLHRFSAQGFVHNDMSRRCAWVTDDSYPWVLLVGRLSLYGKGASRLHEELVCVAAPWTPLSVRGEPLTVVSADNLHPWGLVVSHLTSHTFEPISSAVEHNIRESAQLDWEQLLPQWEQRCAERAQWARQQLHNRGEREARDIDEILENQKRRIKQELNRFQNPDQLALDFMNAFTEAEKQQHKDNARYWERRLLAIPDEKKRETSRIRETYDVVSQRAEPIANIWLWPKTG